MRMPRAQQSSPTKCCSRPCTLHDLALLNLLSGLLSVPGRGPATSAQVHTEDVDRQKKGAHVEGAAVFAAGDDVIEAAWSWHDFSTYVMISAEGCSLAVQLGKGNEIIMPIWCAATNAAVAYRCGPYPRAHYNSPRRATLRMLRPAAMPEQCQAEASAAAWLTGPVMQSCMQALQHRQPRLRLGAPGGPATFSPTPRDFSTCTQ